MDPKVYNYAEETYKRVYKSIWPTDEPEIIYAPVERQGPQNCGPLLLRNSELLCSSEANISFFLNKLMHSVRDTNSLRLVYYYLYLSPSTDFPLTVYIK